jgi:endonuclease/exonuclease/phosphatase family metal-dependent hydrolase
MASDTAPSHPNPAIRLVPWRGVERRDQLASWRNNVGAPVALDLVRAEPRAPLTSLAVLSWNLWIGHGRLEAVVRRIRETTDAPLVALVQEAYRSDETLPTRAARRADRRAAGGFRSRARPRGDIVEAARALSLNLRYVPSMRNGTGPSDRGNAILSDLPFGETWAFELPLVLQRRVPIEATILLPAGPLHLVTAHLDPRGPPGAAWLGVAGRARQTEYLVEQLGGDLAILGADLNLGRGRRERSWRLLHEAEFVTGVPPVVPHWTHTFHATPRLMLDYILLRDRTGRVAQARVERMDEHERDRGPTVFGSDHHPLLARLDFHPHAGAHP